MSKKKRQLPPYGKGFLAALGVYLVGLLLLALLAVKGIVPEGALFPMVAVCGSLAAFLGSLLCAESGFAGGMLGTLAFAAFQTAVGLLCWDGILWMGHGGILLACTLVSGGLAALSRRKRGHRRKGKRR